MSTQETPWSAFGCKRSNYVPFDFVTHTTHLSNAFTIFQQGVIRPCLIYDESRLNKKRILVVWLSPNHWGNGFRYGTFQFAFDWRAIIKNKRFYWVEAIEYKIPACRILVTEREHPKLQAYLPATGDGPWWDFEKKGEHRRNPNVCLEFLIEDEILVRRAQNHQFVSHHGEWCSEHRYAPKNCAELGMFSQEASARFVAGIVGKSISMSEAHFSIRKRDGTYKPRIDLLSAWLWLKMELGRKTKFTGRVKVSDSQASALAKAVLAARSANATAKGARELESLFASKSDLMEACVIQLEKTFRLPVPCSKLRNCGDDIEV